MCRDYFNLNNKLLLNRGIYGVIMMVSIFLAFTACEFEEPIPTYTLTTSVSPNEGGKITRSPELPNYKTGDVVTLSPEPNEHWVFKQWDGDATGNTTPLQVSMNSNKTITGVFVKRDYPLNIKIEGQGTVEEKIIPNPSGREYPHGTRVELKPIAKEGWVFESWGGDLSGNETPQILTVDKEKNVVVKFNRRDYPLNITITGEGTVEEKIVSVPGGKTYPFETVVELKPVPKLGWVFESWGGDLTGNEATKNIAVDKEKNVTVNFKRKDYPLNVTISGEGTVEEKIVSSPGGRSYPYQTVVELAPKPKEGWVFEGWAGDLTGNEAPKNITVDKEKNVTAKFKRRDYPLNLILEGEGLVEEKIVSSPGDRTYPFQTVVELTPKPKDGWVFESWGGDLTGNEVPKTITIDKEKNVTVKFKRKDYLLNITITGEGTVEEKIVSNPGGRTYPFLTVVELTPKPKEGWEFESWGGDLTGNEAPKNITLDKEKNVTVKFKESIMSYTKQTFEISSTKHSTKAIEATMSHVSGAFIYKDSRGEIFAFYPGFAVEGNFNSLETVPPVNSQILRKVNGQWERFKEDEKAQFWSARNLKIIGDKVVVADANEIGPNPFPSMDKQWRGNILYGKILTGGIIDWVTVNKPEDMGYFHGVTMGDLNKDGLLDIGGTPGRLRPDTGYDLDIFYQESVNQFKFVDNSIPSDGRTFGAPFTLEFEDLFGDARAEIITANYGGGAIPGPDDHEMRVFSFDEQTNKYVQKFKANNPSAYTSGLGATSIKSFDVNKDGIKDIAVAREGYANGLNLAGFEVWLGKSNGTFEFSFSTPTWTEKEMQFREFEILDANNDGFLDIILIPFHWGSLYRAGTNCAWGNNVFCTGIKLNHLIWLNKKDGTFSNYNKSPLILSDVRVNFLLPYKVGDYLHFLGNEAIGDWPNFSSKYNVYDIRVKLD